MSTLEDEETCFTLNKKTCLRTRKKPRTDQKTGSQDSISLVCTQPRSNVKTKNEKYFKDKVFIFTVQSSTLDQYFADLLNILEHYLKRCQCMTKQFFSGAEHFKSKESCLREVKIY